LQRRTTGPKSISFPTGDSRNAFEWKGVFNLKQNSSVKNPQHKNGDYEMLMNYGDPPDGEFDQRYPYQPDGEPYQYQNHDMHHNVPEHHKHAPYYMHKPHDDCKSYLVLDALKGIFHLPGSD